MLQHKECIQLVDAALCCKLDAATRAEDSQVILFRRGRSSLA